MLAFRLYVKITEILRMLWTEKAYESVLEEMVLDLDLKSRVRAG